MYSQTTMKPGGNYTQPHYDPITEEVEYQVYVGWVLIGKYDNDAEATYELHKAMEDNGRANVDHG